MPGEPSECIVELDDFSEAALIGKLRENECGGRAVRGHAANRNRWPDPIRLLQIGEIRQTTLHGIAGAPPKQQRPEAQGTDRKIAPPAIAFLHRQ